MGNMLNYFGSRLVVPLCKVGASLVVGRVERIPFLGHSSMCSSAVVVAGKWGLDVLLDTHCHVHVPSDSAAATVVPPQRAAEYANRCCSQENISSPSIQDRKIDQLAFGTEEVERAPSTQPMRVARITMGIREQDWADAVIFGKDNLCSNGLLHRRSQEASRPQASSLTVSRKEVEESVHTVGDLDPFFRFGVGLHPWYAHSKSDDWLRDLTALLRENPRAVVGEIGLDKVSRTPETGRVEWDHQLEVFQSQMALAAMLSRPVSVHCVKAYGKLVEFLREEESIRRGTDAKGPDIDPTAPRGLGYRSGPHLPPRIALHSFTGSIEVTKDILRLRAGRSGEVFFGFSSAVNMRGDREKKRLADILRVIPDSQILIETDRRASAPGTTEELVRVCGAISEAKGVSVEEAGMLANRNALRFLAEISPPREEGT
ncbi:unnamed protein product [Ascophyllum nodosum]